MKHDLDGAAKLLEKAVTLEPNNASTWSFFKRFAIAAPASACRVILLYPYRCRYVYGCLLDAAGRKRKAEDAFKKAIAVDPAHSQALYALGELQVTDTPHTHAHARAHTRARARVCMHAHTHTPQQ